MRALILALAFAALASPALAQVCAAWAPPTLLAEVASDQLTEASGLEASTAFAGRLYHHNDSGDDLRFFVSDAKGGNLKSVAVKGAKPDDVEDMALGPCDGGTCLYLADTGDNGASRSEVAFTLVREKAEYADEETPLRVVRARYPDGPQNVEAVAVHPGGDLFVVTKPADAQMSTPGAARVYRLSAGQLREAEGVQVFRKVGELDLPRLLPDLPFFGWIPTGLDISGDGERAVLLTYMAVIELGVDLTAGVPDALKAGENVSIFTAPPLAQQEAIAWLPDDAGFLYDSEIRGEGKSFPLYEVRCQKR
ncbi:MAG: hypothetical protein IT546_03940 [Caulobacteraceae bacterium]|nr:hypothetical protein [Caulobacteraceae bacterium]